jgi:hypothetical protein
MLLNKLTNKYELNLHLHRKMSGVQIGLLQQYRVIIKIPLHCRKCILKIGAYTIGSFGI